MKTVIVSGASGNLGHAVITKFLANDYKVIGTVTVNETLSFSSHKNFVAGVVDLTKEEAVKSFMDSTLKKNVKIDVGVLTVGGYTAGKIAETGIIDIRQQFMLNFETAYNIARPLFLHMLRQGSGKIFLTGARPGIEMRHSKGMAAYGLSKSLIFRLAELMNEEAKGTDVNVTVIVPSTIDTPQNRKSMPDSDPSKWIKAEDIAAMIYANTAAEFAGAKEMIIKAYNKA
jgi:NAD(P)-dependent dehydrogenase (short-subunit alcohol dehydrogenase family)